MQIVNIHDAKTQFSKLLKQVQSGEDIVIARAGQPIARLVPYTPPKRDIYPPGAMKDKIWIADDFDTAIDNLFECVKET